ncbi:MAG TPA: hypothetical protein VES39_12365 [Rhodospirillales bacterium]|nr:hypothetical protein [Rhodospirillales bacterium]
MYELRVDTPKAALLMTVEQLREVDLGGGGAVEVYPSIPLPNNETWDDFSAVIDLALPTGERLRRRARFGKVHPSFRLEQARRGEALPFWMMTVTIFSVRVSDVPVGSVIFADESVVARLTPGVSF